MTWSQELVWVARNDRGEIIRVQDDHHSVAIEVAEGIQDKVKGMSNVDVRNDVKRSVSC